MATAIAACYAAANIGAVGAASLLPSHAKMPQLTSLHLKGMHRCMLWLLEAFSGTHRREHACRSGWSALWPVTVGWAPQTLLPGVASLEVTL